jgi:hypothetical protein
MNHSMRTCGVTTHIKIVAVALVAAALVTTAAFKNGLDDASATNMTAKAGGPALKAGRPAVYSIRNDATVR